MIPSTTRSPRSTRRAAHLLHPSLAPLLLVLCACGDRTGLLADTLAALPPGSSIGPSPSPACAASPWLVFTLTARDTSRLYARRLDGTGGHTVGLSDAAMYASASADGSAILYVDSTVTVLSLYKFASGSTTRLATQGTVGFGSLSPDGQTVIYGDGTSLFAIGVSGGPARTLVSQNVAPGNAAGHPIFLGGSSTVLYAAVGVLQSVGVDGTGMQTLLTVDGGDGPSFPNPTLSPDGTQVAAIVSCAGEMPSLRVYPMGTLPVPCTAGRQLVTVGRRLNSYDPAWGLAGIAYSEGPDVVLVDVASGTSKDITSDLTSTNGISASYPTWVNGCVAVP